ncbi:MAG: HAMP domain-containing histidine kinase [Chitinophagaceae bacterium]|nr:MAG: HAMP domain-containing histidine kinase [Chitinophagaceae bacterium]
MNVITRDNPITTHVALHLLLNQLSIAVLPAASQRNNTLVNEINPCLLVRTNAARLGKVVRQLLDTINRNCENSQIFLSAKIFGDVLLFQVRQKSPVDNINFTEFLAPLRQMAEGFYDNVSVSTQRSNVTTLAFSYQNQSIAA